uniref:Uncharacterized protein n=1 Tax=Aegilops tauschii subsp. strangulata TaxID=200361 RepID=A0A453CFC9_AEGTS
KKIKRRNTRQFHTFVGERGKKRSRCVAMAGEEQPLTEYEKQRLARIRENEARLQALGIRRLAASPLLNQPS